MFARPACEGDLYDLACANHLVDEVVYVNAYALRGERIGVGWKDVCALLRQIDVRDVPASHSFDLLAFASFSPDDVIVSAILFGTDRKRDL